MNAFRTPVVCLSAAVLFLSVSLAAQQPHSVAPSAQSAPLASSTLPPVLDQGARLNPNKIALLHWYLGNTVTRFKVGSQPYGLCFDGANIWSANYGDGTVSKIRASDGANLGTFQTSLGAPYGVTFDGANIWVSDGSDYGTSVAKLRASDGKNLGTFKVGQSPGWMAFDGQHIWVPNGFNGTVTELSEDGKTLGTFPAGTSAVAAAFDGENVWITNNGDGTVTKLRASDGKLVGTYSVGHGALGIAFDGANMWIANRGDGTVSELRASDGSVVGTYPYPIVDMVSRTTAPTCGFPETTTCTSCGQETDR